MIESSISPKTVNFFEKIHLVIKFFQIIELSFSLKLPFHLSVRNNEKSLTKRYMMAPAKTPKHKLTVKLAPASDNQWSYD